MICKTINKRNFEQSIELIYPSKPKNNNKYPLLIYIGGTGWLGYFPIIYRIADFWNKRMIYKLVNDGYSCAIIRYRGKFFNECLNDGFLDGKLETIEISTLMGISMRYIKEQHEFINEFLINARKNENYKKNALLIISNLLDTIKKDVITLERLYNKLFGSISRQ